MKKLSILALIMVLTAFVFTGCRNNNKPMETTRPAPAPTTQATTAPSTQPSTAATQPSETMDNGNGPMDPTNGADGTVGEDSTGTTNAAPEGRGIAPMPRGR